MQNIYKKGNKNNLHFQDEGPPKLKPKDEEIQAVYILKQSIQTDKAKL